MRRNVTQTILSATRTTRFNLEDHGCNRDSWCTCWHRIWRILRNLGNQPILPNFKCKNWLKLDLTNEETNTQNH